MRNTKRTLLKTIFSLTIIIVGFLLTACSSGPPPNEPPSVLAVFDNEPQSFVTLRIDEIQILSGTGEWVGERELRLIVIGSDQGEHTATLTCPAHEPYAIQVGDTVPNPCGFGISIAEEHAVGDLYFLILALDEDKLSDVNDYRLEVLINLLAAGVGHAVKGTVLAAKFGSIVGTPALTGGIFLLETAVGYGGGKLIDYGLESDEVATQGLLLSRNQNWYAGKTHEVVSADGHMRLIFSVHLTDTPEGEVIAIEEEETEDEKIAEVLAEPVDEPEQSVEESALPPADPPTSTPTLESKPSPTPQPKEGWQQGKLTFLQGNTLYTMDLENDGSPQELAQISSNAIVLGPLWSPNGRSIVLYDVNGQLYFVNSTNGDVRSGTNNCTSPSWSADGQQILCRSADPQIFEIMDANSGERVREIPRPDRSSLPHWSPNGQDIVFSIFDNPETRRTSIWRMSLSDENPVQLTNSGGQGYAPAWSPDGQWIAYQSIEGSEDSEIWIMDRNGRNGRRLTNTPSGSWSRGPFWSPDGRWIAFVSNQNASSGSESGEIFIVSVDTGETVQITNTGGNVYNWRISWTD